MPRKATVPIDCVTRIRGGTERLHNASQHISGASSLPALPAPPTHLPRLPTGEVDVLAHSNTDLRHSRSAPSSQRSTRAGLARTNSLGTAPSFTRGGSSAVDTRQTGVPLPGRDRLWQGEDSTVKNHVTMSGTTGRQRNAGAGAVAHPRTEKGLASVARQHRARIAPDNGVGWFLKPAAGHRPTLVRRTTGRVMLSGGKEIEEGVLADVIRVVVLSARTSPKPQPRGAAKSNTDGSWGVWRGCCVKLAMLERVCVKLRDCVRDFGVWQMVAQRKTNLPVDDFSADLSIDWKELVRTKITEAAAKAIVAKIARIDKEDKLGIRPPGFGRILNALEMDFKLHVNDCVLELGRHGVNQFDNSTCIRCNVAERMKVGKGGVLVATDMKTISVVAISRSSLRSVLVLRDIRVPPFEKWRKVGRCTQLVLYNTPIQQVGCVTTNLGLGVWAETSEIVLLTVSLHHALTISAYLDRPISMNSIKIDDVDSSRGLHDLTVSLEIRTQGRSLWQGRWGGVFCKSKDAQEAVFVLDGDETSWANIGAELCVPWRTSSFGGKVEGVVSVDVTVWDEARLPFMCMSNLVAVIDSPSDNVPNMRFSAGEASHLALRAEDANVGHVTAEILRRVKGRNVGAQASTQSEIRLQRCSLALRWDAVDAWFGTCYHKSRPQVSR